MPRDVFPEGLWVMPAFEDPGKVQLIHLTPECRNPFNPLGRARTHQEMTDRLWEMGFVDVEALLKAAVAH